MSLGHPMHGHGRARVVPCSFGVPFHHGGQVGVPENEDAEVRELAFSCLVEIADEYYEHLATGIEAIFHRTMAVVRNTDEPEDVAMQAIEFWSAVAEREAELLELMREAERLQLPQQATELKGFIRGAVKPLTEAMLQTLVRQEDGQDEETWNVSTAGALCLSRMATAIEDEITPHVLPFVQQHIQSPDWRFREAAVMAFSSILDGPDQSIVEAVPQAMPLLLQHMQDQVQAVKDTAAWTVGKVCEFHPNVVCMDLNPVIASLQRALEDESAHIASVACWSIHSIAEYVADPDSPDHLSMDPYLDGLVNALLVVTQRPDANKHNLRCSAIEALNILIKTADDSKNEAILQLLSTFLQQLNGVLALPAQTDESMEIIGLYCSVVHAIAQKLAENIMPATQHVMNALQAVLKLSSNTLQEEALMAVGTMAQAIGSEFSQYYGAFAEFLYRGIQNYPEYTVCHVTVGVIGDCCRAMKEQLAPHCPQLVQLLCHTLEQPDLDQQVKPAILSTLGDLAMAAGGSFKPLLGPVMQVLHRFSSTTVDQNDPDQVLWLFQVHESILEACTGIVQSLEGAAASQQLQQLPSDLPQIAQFMIAFCCHVWGLNSKDESVAKIVLGLLGDILNILGPLSPEIQHQCKQAPVVAVIQQGASHSSEQVRELARYAQGG